MRQVNITGKLTGFDYDPVGQLLRFTDDGKELAAYTYNPDGTPKAVTHGPIRQEYAYDLDKNLTGLTVHSGDALLARNSYAYDGNGNRTLKRQLGGIRYNKFRKLKSRKKRHGLQPSGRMKSRHTILKGASKPCLRRLYS